MSYVDLTTFQRYVGADTDTDADILQDVLDEAQEYIENATNRVFEAAADTTRYFDYFRDVIGYVLKFDQDICQFTSIVNGDGTTVSPSSYVTNPRNFTPYFEVQLKYNSGVIWNYTTSPENAIAVTGRWAYSVTPPKDIVRATKRLAKWFYNQRDTSAEIDRPQLTTSGTTLLPSAIPKDVQTVIDSYTRPYTS